MSLVMASGTLVHAQDRWLPTAAGTYSYFDNALWSTGSWAGDPATDMAQFSLSASVAQTIMFGNYDGFTSQPVAIDSLDVLQGAFTFNLGGNPNALTVTGLVDNPSVLIGGTSDPSASLTLLNGGLTSGSVQVQVGSTASVTVGSGAKWNVAQLGGSFDLDAGSVNVTNGGILNMVTSDASNPGAQWGFLNVGEGSDNANLNVTAGGQFASDAIATFGAGSGTTTANVSGTGSLLSLNGGFFLGQGTGSSASASATIQNGATLNTDQGNGSYALTAIGASALGSSSLTIESQAVWNSPGDQNMGEVLVGDVGTGTLTIQTGGSANLGTVDVGYGVGSSGTVLLSGLPSNHNDTFVSNWLIVGDQGTGSVTLQENAVASVGLLYVGNTPTGVGSIFVNGDDSSDNPTYSGTTLNIGDGSVVGIANAGTTMPAVSAPSNATLTVTDAQLNDPGSLTVGGAAYVNNSTLQFGNGLLAILSSDAQATIEGNLNVGAGGLGAVQVFSGATLNMPPGANIYLGQTVNFQQYDYEGDVIANIDPSGNGSLTVSDGSNVFATSAFVGDSATGALTLTGGSQLVLTQSSPGVGGSMYVGNLENLADGTTHLGNGTVTMVGSELNIESGLFAGYGGNGTVAANAESDLNLNSSDLTIGSTVVVLGSDGVTYTPYAGTGSVTLSSNSTLEANNLWVGFTSTGTLNVNNSLVNAADLDIAGSSTLADGNLYIGNGSVNVTGDPVGGQGMIELNGGNLYAGDAGVGQLTITGTNNFYTSPFGSFALVDAGAVFVGEQTTGTGTVTLQNGALNVNGDLVIGDYGTGTVNVNGDPTNGPGLLETNGNTVYVGNYGTGTLNITGVNSSYDPSTGQIPDAEVNAGTFLIGEQSSGMGTVTLTNGVLNVSGNLIVGDNGTGTLQVNGTAVGGQNQSLVNAGELIVANYQGSIGTFNVTNSTVTAANSITLGGGGSASGAWTGASIVTPVLLMGASDINTSAPGLASFTASGTTIFVGNDGAGNYIGGSGGVATAVIGGQGTATLGLDNSLLAIGPVSPADSTQEVDLALGQMGGSSGTLSLANLSVMNLNDGNAYVGLQGSGTLTADNSSIQISQNGTPSFGGGIYVGSGSTGVGFITLTNDAELTTDFEAVVGGAGSGSLNVNSGSEVVVGDTGTGDLRVGDLQGSSGTVTVSGADSSLNPSTLTADNNLVIGNAGTGAVSVTAGAQLAAGTGASNVVSLGSSSTGVGSLTVNAAAAYITGNMLVGDAGSGTLTIENNGLVSVSGSVTIANQKGSTGQIIVNDAGANLTVGGDLNVGAGGTGLLSIDRGTSATVTGNVNNGSGGTVTGRGSLTATSLNNGGLIDLASSGTPGIFSLTGNFSQSSTGALDLLVNGKTLDSQYSQLSITGSAALGGVLDVILGSNYTYHPGDTFDLLTFGSNPTGLEFSTELINGAAYNPKLWDFSFGSSGVQLQAVPEPSEFVAFGLGASLLGLSLRRRKAA